MNHQTMSTETQVSPVVETQNQTADNAETPEVAAPEIDTEAEAKSESKSDDDKSLERMNRRIAKRTADYYRERARAEALAEELQRLTAGAQSERTEATPVDLDRLAEEKAAIRVFAEKANSIVEKGQRKNTDFMDVVRDLESEVGPFVLRDGKPSAFMETVLDVADDPVELMYYLGKKPDVAAELADLSPRKLAIRLDRIQRDMSESSKPKTSKAPQPLDPVKPKSSDNGLSSDLPVDEWMRRREKEIKGRRA